MLKSIIIFLLSLLTISTYADDSNKRISIQYPGLNLLNKAKLIKGVEANKKIDFFVWMKLRNQQRLEQLIQEIYDPSSPNYQQFLTREAIEQEFAPTQQREEAVKNYLTQQGMQAEIINHDIHVKGTVKQIEQAFKVKLNYYRFQNKTIFSNNVEPSMPAEIARLVIGISGFDNIPRYTPSSYNPQKNNDPVEELHFIWDGRLNATPTTTSLSGFSGAQLQTTYKLSSIPAVNGTNISGAGQTLVVVDDCGDYNSAQITSAANQYFTANSITPFSGSNFAIVNPDGTTFTTCANPNSAFNNEISIDIESSHTIAPGDNTVLVLGQSQTIGTRDALKLVISNLVSNNKTIAGFSNANVISNSWSGAESAGTDPALDSKLQLAAANGISVNFSSGDCGDNTYNSTNASSKCQFAGQPHTVDYPSSSPYVTAIGATSLFVDSSYNYAFETGWGNFISGGFAAGTGGGISQYYGPVSWQSSIYNFTAGGYGVISTYGSHRALPDISMLGDPTTGLIVYIYNGQTNVPLKDGGTSLACPLFSGAIVLVNQARSILNKSPIGQVAPYLYTQNSTLLRGRAINRIIPPHQIISGAQLPPSGAPLSAFTLHNGVTYGWDSSLTIEPESQFWNDAAGIGSPYLPNFVDVMARM